LRKVILEDKLGICQDLEKYMEELVASYFCEWTETVNNPERRKQFQQFANVDETMDTIEYISERGQTRPANWPKEAVTEDFGKKKQEWTSLAWQPILEASSFKDIATGDSQQVKRGDTQLAIFKVRGKYYCTQQMCPHKRAFVLSDGLIGEDRKTNKMWVSCPLHKRNYELGGEEAGKCGNDDLSIATFDVEERDDGWVYVRLPPVEELDGVLGTKKWMVKKDETQQCDLGGVDEKLKSLRTKKGRKVANGNGAVQSNGSGDAMEW